jgi:hypothetical protein
VSTFYPFTSPSLIDPSFLLPAIHDQCLLAAVKLLFFLKLQLGWGYVSIGASSMFLIREVQGSCSHTDGVVALLFLAQHQYQYHQADRSYDAHSFLNLLLFFMFSKPDDASQSSCTFFGGTIQAQCSAGNPSALL